MPDDADLLLVKQSEMLMLEALGIQKPGQHCPCALCGDKTALRVGLDKKGTGVWLCQCMKCSKMKGTVLDVHMILNRMTFADAANTCKAKLGLASRPVSQFTRTNGVRQSDIDERLTAMAEEDRQRISEVPPEPTIDLAAAEEFVDQQHKALMNRDDLIETWLTKKRGISEDVAKQYKLGFLDRTPLSLWSGKNKEWYTSTILSAWVLPITDAKGRLKAVKIHHEIIKKDSAGKDVHGKCFWMPFAKQRGDGVDKYNCFWPHINIQKQQIKGINFTASAANWISRLPEGEVKARYQERYSQNLYNLTEEGPLKGLHPDQYGPPQLEYVEQRTFEEMRKEIQQEALGAIGSSEQMAAISLHNWTIWAPGELKALSYISSNIRATALTAGETYMPTPGMLRCFRGQRVGLNWDFDIPQELTTGEVICAGRKWLREATRALAQTNVLEVRAFNWGRK